MISVSFLEKLLDGTEAKWVPLGKLGELVLGRGLFKSDFTETGVPAIHYGQIYTSYGLSTQATISFVSPETATNLKKVNKGDVVIAHISVILENVGTSLVYFGEEQAVTGGNATIFKPGELILGMYFAYFTQTPEFALAKKKYAKKGGVVSVSKKDMAKIQIPIPCPDDPKKSLKIQAEIVRILDTFIALIAALTAELTARKKQYNYYRDQLLTFEEGDVEWKELGSVVNLKRGKRLVKSQLEETGNYAVHQNSMKPLGYYHESNVKPDTVFIICAGAAAGGIGYSDIAFWAADDVCICLDADNLLSKFLYYCLLNQQNKILAQVRRASIPRLSKVAAEKLKIPIPYPNDTEKSLAEQARIVTILDKFDALTNSIQEGLPREIELRQKQYEYYRDLLLNFPKPEKTAT